MVTDYEKTTIKLGQSVLQPKDWEYYKQHKNSNSSSQKSWQILFIMFNWEDMKRFLTSMY